MTSYPYILSRATYRDIRDAAYEVAVLPWGATEAHNLHLPYGTDNYEADSIAAEAARLATQQGAKVIVLPTVPFGVNTGQLDIPLTINMNPSTQMALLDDIIASLEPHNVRKLVVLNSHGGNDFRQMIRELRPKRGMFLCALNWYRSVPLHEFFDSPGDHADEMETSLMMHIGPELVLPLTEAGSGAHRRPKISAFREGWAWSPRQWTKVTRDTGTGDPRAATPDKGKKYFEAVTRKIGLFLAELDRGDPDDLYEERPEE
ncbi:MAG: creatininase family protein [Ignavibacteria bacterium]|nr:creatininase family protein [Ignavibacteria bacterium]